MYRILTVCTGNICRSPAVEILLRSVLDRSVEVGSAGTYGLISHAISRPMGALLAADGLNSDRFRSHALTTEMAQDADLILPLTSDHRRQILEISPLALRKTITLGEFARLSAAVPPGTISGDDDDARFAQLVPAAVALRHTQPGPHDDDVPDPYRQGDAAYLAAYTQIKAHVSAIRAALGQ